jgi:hypothetical protein
MNVNSQQAAWVHALASAEDQINAALRTLPHDQVPDHADDLRIWADNLADGAIARSARILTSLGYSRPDVVATLGISPGRLDRIARSAEIGRQRPVVTRVTDRIPADYIDFRDEFTRLYAMR